MKHAICRFITVAGLLLTPSITCLAESGVTADSISLGQSVPLSGPLAALGTDYRDGARLYFDSINSQGGVAGRKIKLVSLDDGYTVEKTVANTKKLIDQEHVFALFNMLGTANIQAILPVVSDAGIPLFSMLTGAESLRTPFNRYLFHTRAAYAQEATKLVEHASIFGLKKMAVAYQNNTFGKAGLHDVEQAIAKRGFELVAAVPVEVNSSNVAAAVEQIAKAEPQGVVVITTGKSSVDFISAYRKKQPATWLLALSVVSSQELVKTLGEQSRGIVISQVVPYPWGEETRMLVEYHDLMKKAGKDQKNYSYASLEGFISAKLLVEALRKAGKDLTREKLIAVLESTEALDAGGFQVKFTPSNHNGSPFVDATMIGANGKFIK